MSREYDIVSTYSGPQTGGELPYFVGKQYGSGWLQVIGRLAFPILKRIGKLVGKTFNDVVVNKKPFVSSLKDNALEEVNDFIPSLSRKRKSEQDGEGRKKKRKTINKHKSMGTIFQ